ncbi:monocarboxylate transporter 12-like isoform X2 [Scylla paramamosain]|uniref:monocarboxylate transporter 12-like isoform X2 n=1 Tax=Scylla paramamosain TaxID=85552 RepID=UPI0030835F72
MGSNFKYNLCILCREKNPEDCHSVTPSTQVQSWVGSSSLAVSRVTAPLVVALCRRKSTRLTAVIGGLVMALAVLFASFALHLHQVFLSYGLVLGVGVGMTREAANLMLGQYFRRRREFVEIIAQSGCGIGVTLFSVFFKEAIRSVGWRLGLQAVTGVVFSSFFLGIFYRSASLYHPQRRAILHIKNQKRKQVRDKYKIDSEKPPYFDLTCLKLRSVQILITAAAVASVGLYTPLFYLILDAQTEGLEDSALILLQTFLGFAYALGCIGFGLIVVKQSAQCMISRQYLCQASMYGLGVTMLALTAVRGYYGYVLFMWLYGLLLGGAHYAFQMLTLEKVRTRHFSRAWGYIQGSTALPILLGVPVTGYINESNPKSGYFFASIFLLGGASCLFLLNYFRERLSKHDTTVSFTTVDSHLAHDPYAVPLENGGGGAAATGSAGASGSNKAPMAPPPQLPKAPVCTCGADSNAPPPPPALQLPGPGQDHAKASAALNKLGKTISFATSVDVVEPKLRPELLTCISEEGLLDHYYDYVVDCVNSCRHDDFCSERGSVDGERDETDDEGLEPRPRHHQHQHHRPHASQHPRFRVHLPHGRRLGQASGVSFSEPEDLARLGQGGCGSGRRLAHSSPAHHAHHEYTPPPLPAPRPPILRRQPQPATRPRRNITVIEEMTTSV